MTELCSEAREALAVRRPGLVAGVAEGFEGAVGAAGFAGQADLAAVVDELMRELDPAVLREDFDEVALDLYGLSMAGELEAAREA